MSGEGNTAGIGDGQRPSSGEQAETERLVSWRKTRGRGQECPRQQAGCPTGARHGLMLSSCCLGWLEGPGDSLEPHVLASSPRLGRVPASPGDQKPGSWEGPGEMGEGWLQEPATSRLWKAVV